ncbi:MAG: hypothetical protein O7F16_01235 [Acidobacteria bacterium]|nr:hypothetical protein [Acidobacteriota bacterium]
MPRVHFARTLMEMSGAALAFHFFLLGAVQLPGSGVVVEPAEEPPDLEELMRDVQHVHFLDISAWSRFRFQRQVHKERLDGEGQPVSYRTYQFQVTPVNGGFEERLTSRDGKPPTSRQIRHHREAASFTHHYNALRSGQEDSQDDEGNALAHLLYMPSYTYGGREKMDGVDCYRLDFGPQEKTRKGSLQARIARAMVGSLWIGVEDHHLVRARSRTSRSVSVALSLTKVSDVQIDLLNKPVALGVWLPHRLEIVTKGRVSWWPIRRRSIFHYSDFQSVHGGTIGKVFGNVAASP